MTKTDRNVTPIQRRAINLRLDGLDFDEIAYRLGVDRTTAIEHVQEELEKLPDLQENEKFIIIELERIRLDALQLPLFLRLEKDGDLDTIGPILDIMDRRARLLTLYAQ
jgi:hypothetical protein